MKKMKGFTLIELLSTLAISGVTLTMGVSSMQQLVVEQRVSAYAGSLLQTVHNARQHAIIKGEIITVCASKNGETCSKDWSAGHLIFVDQNGNRERDEEDSIINQVYGSHGSDPVTWRSFKVASTLQFLPSGITNHQNGTFTICGNNKVEFARAVIITKMGRPRMSKDEDGDGIDEGANGKPLSC